MEQEKNSSTSLISLKKAGKIYSHITALKKIDLDIHKGQSITIFGPNGAGKSTLLKILSMQNKLSYGELFYNGIACGKINNSFKKSFGVISHAPFLYENLSAMDNLKFYGSLYNVNKVEARAKELLNQLDLYKRKDDIIKSFSRGMLQRVSIARALIHNPDIIFLDEPYTGLDSAASNKLSELIKSQISEHKTIIMVTHDITTGLNLANRVVIINKGSIIYENNKANIDITTFEKTYIDMVENKVAI